MADGFQKTNVAVPFSAGLDRKSDPRQTPIARLQVCENGTFVTPLSIRKRFGNRALPTTIANSTLGLTNIKTGRALMSFVDELIECDPSRLYSLANASQQWIEKGSFVPLTPTLTPVIRNSTNQSQQDGVRHANGMECYAWEDSSGASVSVRYAVKDSNTQQTVVANGLVSATAVRPKVVAIGAYFAIWHVEPSGTPLLRVALLAANAPTSALSFTTITGGSGSGVAQLNPTTYSYDVAVITNPNLASTAPAYVTMYVAFNNNQAIHASASVFALFSTAPSVVAQTYSVAAATTSPATVINIFGDLNVGAPVLVTWTTGQSIQWRALSAFVTSGAPTVLHSGSFGATPLHVVSISGAGRSTTVAGDFDIYFSQWDNSGTTLNATTKIGIGTAYSLGGTSTLTRSAALMGKAFLYEGVTYAPCAYESELNSTYFVIGSSGQIVGRFLSGLGGGLPVSSSSGQSTTLAETSATSATAFLCPLLVKDLLTTFPGTTVAGTPAGSSGGTVIYTQTGITAAVFDFLTAETAYLRAVIASSLFLNGGALAQYDGGVVTEAGFHVYPELTTGDLTPSNTGGSLGNATQATTYWTCFTYQWTDNTGAVQISEPSVPIANNNGITPTFASGVVAGQLTWTVPTLRLTNKSGVTINGYRTTGIDPGIFYLAQNTQTPVTSASGIPNAPIINDPTNDTVTFIDNMSDADLVGQPRLYSTGGVLENEAPPAFIAMVPFQSRLFAVSAENPLQVWYTQTVLQGQPLMWSSFLTENLDASLGAASGLGVIDGNLVIFGETSILVLSGQGPDSTGNNNQYADAVPVRTEVGCVNPKSIVGSQDGLLFQSAKGIYLLNRALVSAYVGAPVEALVQNMLVTSSLLIPTLNQTRHTVIDPLGVAQGIAVVMDTFASEWLATPNAAAIHSWSSFSPVAAVDACIWQDEFMFLNANGTAFVETPNLYSDNGSAIQTTVVTGPIRTNGIGNSQFVYRLWIIGTYESTHALEVAVSYNGGPFLQPAIIQPQMPATWGSDDFWGESSPWGGGFQPYIWEVILATAKCESIQVQIKDVDTTPGEGMSLSGLMLRIGVQDGGFRVPQVGIAS